MSTVKSKQLLLWAEVKLSALEENLRAIRRRAGESADILAVVKADAYGHGMREVARCLARQGVRFFGVANIDEAAQLRQVVGAKAQILSLGSFHPSQLDLYVRHRVLPTISSMEDLRLVSEAVPRRGRFPVHLKIDTGMGRLGIFPEEADFLFRNVSKMTGVAIEGIYTHFSSADDLSSAPTDRQIELFENALK